MTVTPIRAAEPPPLSDSAVPALEVLLGPGAAPLLAEIATTRGAELGASFARRQVRYRPGRSVIVEFTLELVIKGQARREILTVASGLDDDTPTPFGEYDGTDYRWWWFPQDPYLPGLALVDDREALADVLSQLGVNQTIDRLRTRAYRATRRAVVEIQAGRQRVFLKIVTPERVDPLHRIHRELADLLPVPPSHGIARDHGVLVLGAVTGEPLRNQLRGDAWNDWVAVASLGKRFGALNPEGRAQVLEPRRRMKGFRPLIEVIAPDDVDLVDELAGDDRLAPRMSVTVHGDFHAGQILVDPSRPDHLGLVDLDTVGAGDPIGDRASMIGQLIVLADQDTRYVGALAPMHEALGSDDDPKRLAAWTAAHIVGLATGPFRAQEEDWASATQRRLALARSVYSDGVSVLLR